MSHKILDLAALSPADSDSDVLSIVDVDDTSMDSTGTNKRITVADLRTQLVNSTASQAQAAQFKKLTLYPGATDGGGDVDGIVFVDPSTGHANQAIRFSSILFANGHYDPVMNWGYNLNPGGTRPTGSEPALAWQLEGDYDDGAFHQMETYLAYESADGTINKRPIFVQVNRSNHTATVLLCGAISLAGWTAANGSSLADTISITSQYFYLRDSGIGGTVPTIVIAETNNRAVMFQTANPAGPNTGLLLKHPYYNSSDQLYCDRDVVVNGPLVTNSRIELPSRTRSTFGSTQSTTPNITAGDRKVFAVNNSAGAVTLTINGPSAAINTSQRFAITCENATTGGGTAAFVFFASAYKTAGNPAPAQGFQITLLFEWESDSGVAREIWRSGSVAN